MKNKIVISGIIITILSIFAYAILRSGSIEKKHISSLAAISTKISKDFKKLEEKSGRNTIDLSVMKSFAGRSGKKYKQTALIAIKDKKGSIKIASKNDSIIKSAKAFNSIIQEFSDGNLIILPSSRYLVRYINAEGTGKEKKKFYLFSEKTSSYSILLMYPYSPGHKLITGIVLEIVLMCLLIIILHALFYIRQNRKYFPEKSADEKHETDETPHDTGINIENEHRIKTKNKSESSTEILNAFVIELFSSINSNHSPDSVSLYLKNEKNKLTKSFEHKGNSFIKIESISFDTIDIDNEIGTELRRGIPLVLDNSTKIIIPVLFEQSLLGIVMIKRIKPFSGNETGLLKEEIQDNTREMSNYIVMNNVMVDRESGLLSKTSFELKLTEMTALKTKSGTDFSILMIEPIGKKKDIPQEKIYSLIKTISPGISEYIGSEDHIFLYNNMISVIMPGISSDKAFETAEKIKKALSKYRIKISENSFFYIDPFIAISSSAGETNPQKIKKTAEETLKLALKENRGNIRKA